MGRLIDADELIKRIGKLPSAGMNWFVSAEVLMAIINAPTIEPSAKLDIVRCNDCKYYNTYYHGAFLTHACMWFLDRTMEPNDFCSKAERR